MIKILSHSDIFEAAMNVACTIPQNSVLYGVPRGGVPVAYLLAGLTGSTVTDNPAEATLIVDDLIDSGTTRARYPDKPFIALYGKELIPANSLVGLTTMGWLVFPWEQTVEASAEDICTRLLQFIGEDPSREGLRETPRRFLKAWKEWTSGYGVDPVAELKVEFTDGAEGYDEMVMIDPIPFVSFCEHHLAIIQGTVHLAYIPNGKIAGLSKFCRLVEVFARRLQVQERMTVQIASAIQDVLEPIGCGVVIRAEHTCMSSRGAKVFGAVTTTTALRGNFKVIPEVRAEFLSMIKGRRCGFISLGFMLEVGEQFPRPPRISK